MRAGSITVFLSLLLSLLLALIGTLLEAARIQSAKPFLTENTSHAMQMMFSDYNRELWEDYRLFAFTGEDEEAELEIKRAISAVLFPNENEDNQNNLWEMQMLNFWHIKLLDLSIESKEFLTDEDGEILKHEAAEFMKYQIAEDFVEKLLEMFQIVKETRAAARVSTQKLETVQEMYDYSKEMLELMELIDGIDFGKNGVQYRREKLKVKDSFVKQFLYGGIGKAAGIENGLVWESLKDSYYDPEKNFDMLQNLIKEAEESCQELVWCQERMSSLKAEQEKLNQGGEELGEEEQELLSEKNERNEQIKYEIEVLQNKVKKAEKIKREYASAWKRNSQQLKEKAGDIKVCAKKALQLIPKLEELQKQAAVSIQNYQTVLEQEKEELSSEMYQSFSEDCENLAASLGIEGDAQKKNVCNLSVFQTCLQENIMILSEIENFLSLSAGDMDMTLELLEQRDAQLQAIKQRAAGYHRSEFAFSYKMIEKKKEQKNPMESLKKLGNTTLLSLLIKKEEEISTNNAAGNEKVFGSLKDTDFLNTASDKITEISVENRGLSAMFGEFSSGIPEKITSLSSLEMVGQEVLQEFFLNGYVQTLFYNYTTEEKNEKESVLRYEQEYILSGNECDKDNLASSVKRIVVIRTICNYLSLLSDSARQKEAYAAAAAIAGFTGLEPLVEVLKSAVLLVWAYEEGMVDMAALLQGKKLPILKPPSMITLSFQELLTFGKTLIQKKAAEFSEENTGIGYSDYLYLFFCIQKQEQVLYRMADIVQFNLRKRYDESFSLNEAVFGCRVKGTYSIPAVFFRLPFVNIAAGHKADRWEMEIISEHAY